MSQTRTLPQSKEALLKQYQKRLKDGIRSMVDNFMEIVKAARVLFLTFYLKANPWYFRDKHRYIGEIR